MENTGKPKNTKMAYLFLEGIDVYIEIGVNPEEHGREQRLTIDVEVGFDDAKTHIHDSKEGLENSGFDYALIRDCVHAATRKRTYLLETIANSIADNILALPGALTCALKVSKTRCWADVDRTGVKIFRERANF